MKVWLAGGSLLALLGGALAMAVASQSGTAVQADVRVNGVNIGGMTREQAVQAVKASLPVPQVTVRAAGSSWTVDADRLGWTADVAGTVAAAEQAAAQRSVLDRLQDLIGTADTQDFPVPVRVDAARAQATLDVLTGGLNSQPKNATVAFDSKLRRYVVKADVPGRRLNTAAAAQRFAQAPDLRDLTVPVTESRAQYTAAALKVHADRGNALMRTFTVKLAGTDRAGALTPLEVANLYWVKPGGILPDEKALQVAFGRLTGYIDQPAQNARYAVKGDGLTKVKEQSGVVTDRAAAFAHFKTTVLDPAVKTTTFPSKASKPTLTLAGLPDAAKLELIATGQSTYYGSSPERRTNVAVAARKIHGAVVPQGEIFSFLNTLGSISPGNGFVGGKIISGGRTVDGLGGGVCQVSTTVFRAMYQAGLPVVERNQHSYRVGYYEPQVGYEAAVYDPGVDLKFKNDTSGPLLIKTVNHPEQSRVEVQVWGIKPKRTVSVSAARILSRTPHPAPKYVVNPRLRPGQTVQVDWAQDGYNLYITRTIKDEKGPRTDVTRTSYKPWQAVYEVGPRG
ncbi:VanW family protein [Deinococcus ficus]|uniref:VanW family protein n=1 Tax=Deinococcus ficus TaxID=317577 RepID=UPI0003B49B8A|nr:VanW family protein [Deinococcus ficus]